MEGRTTWNYYKNKYYPELRLLVREKNGKGLLQFRYEPTQYPDERYPTFSKVPMQNLLHYLENPLKGFAGKTIDEVSAFEEKLGSEEHISYGSRTYEVKTSFDGEYQRTYFFYDYADEKYGRKGKYRSIYRIRCRYKNLGLGIRYDARGTSYVATDELTRLMEKAGFTFLGTPQRLFRNYGTHLTYSFDTWGGDPDRSREGVELVADVYYDKD